MKTMSQLLAALIGVGLSAAISAAPISHGPVQGIDVGPAAAFPENAQVTVTVALRLSHAEQLEPLIEALYTPGNPRFRQFLTTDEFRAQFAPSAETMVAVTRAFEREGLTVTRSATAQLHVSGPAARIEHVFGVQLHSFAVPETAIARGYRYRAPIGSLTLPADIAPRVRAVLGLDTRRSLASHARAAEQPPQRVSVTTNTPDPPGLWTVIDFADYYNVNPLYRKGLTGRGHTLGIVTLAAFQPSDAYLYWQTLGLNVSQNRITEVEIDGGSGSPSDASGSIETTIDEQQSGGVAPGANIVVYEAPNSSQGFVDALAAAVDSNQADTVSTSWGLWELFNSDNAFGNGPVTNPVTGQQTTILAAYHDTLIQAAIQGQSLFCSTGDYGAYDSVNSLPTAPSPGQPFSFNPVLSIDSPASDPFITATGATTLAGTQTYSGPPLPAGDTITIDIPREQAWSWDYLAPFCIAAFNAPGNCQFPLGSGGGVSLYFRRPFYQYFVRGMADSVGGQVLFQETPAPPQLIAKVPADFPGRNVPDISANGDPQTGYVVFYTSEPSGVFTTPTYGGTSVVAPQLNGVTSLYVEALHHRIGLLNPVLYLIAGSGFGYHGPNAPLRDVVGGDNWYWRGVRGYDQATGLGVPDVANLLEAIRDVGY
jgi:kumamolisin